MGMTLTVKTALSADPVTAVRHGLSRVKCAYLKQQRQLLQGAVQSWADSDKFDCQAVWRPGCSIRICMACADNRYAALVALRASNSTNIAVATIQNKAGAYVSPYACVFPFMPDELPSSIASPDWNRLDLNVTKRSDKYPMGGLIYLTSPEDLSTLGRACNVGHTASLNTASVLSLLHPMAPCTEILSGTGFLQSEV